MAAGLTVEKGKLGDLRTFLEKFLGDAVEAQSSNLELKLDGALTARSATLSLVELIERAGPYGQGHAQPVFAFPAHLVRHSKVVGKDHVSFTATAGDGAQLRGIAFRCAETRLGRLLLETRDKPLHLAGTLNADFWQGSRRIQLRLLDAAVAS